MLTALDIQNKEFSKGIRGYSEEEVDIFLDELIVDYQGLIDKNAQLEQQVIELNGKLAEYKSTEGAVLKTLESARALNKEISISAEKRADMLVKNAEEEARNILRQTEVDIQHLKAERERLEANIYSLKIRMKNILTDELAKVEGMDKEMLGEK